METLPRIDDPSEAARQAEEQIAHVATQMHRAEMMAAAVEAQARDCQRHESIAQPRAEAARKYMSDWVLGK